MHAWNRYVARAARPALFLLALVAASCNGTVKLDSAARQEAQSCAKPPDLAPPPGAYEDQGIRIDHDRLAPLPDPDARVNMTYGLEIVMDPGQLEQLYHDATHGQAQASWFVCQMEAGFRNAGREAARHLASLGCKALPGCKFAFEKMPFSTDMASGERALTLMGEAFEAEATRLRIEEGLIADALTLVAGMRLAARVRAPAAGAPGDSVWKRPVAPRGEAIEKALGGNLPRGFPTIDRFDKGVATSIKSLDLGAASYADTRVLTRTVTRYIDKVARFNGAQRSGRVIEHHQIKVRALDLAVPGPGTAAQQQALQSLVKYGKSVGVEVNVIVFP